jgi:hypothetical protein
VEACHEKPCRQTSIFDVVSVVATVVSPIRDARRQPGISPHPCDRKGLVEFSGTATDATAVREPASPNGAGDD